VDSFASFGAAVRPGLGPLQEEFYIEQSVEKGIEIDAWKVNCLASSMVDDIFFILQKCSQRGLATANLQCVGAIMGQINTALSTSLRAALESRWKVAVPVPFPDLVITHVCQLKL